MKISNYELTMKELGLLAMQEMLDQYRQCGISLIWTPLPDFNAYVLNILTEKQYVFFNFFAFRPLLEAQRKFHSPFLTNENYDGTITILKKYIHQAGHVKTSEFASRMLGGWTVTPEFYSKKGRTFLSDLGSRHVSILVPSVDKSAVARHFEEQVLRFGDSSLFPYPENLDLSNFIDLMKTESWKLLHTQITKLAPEERLSLHRQVRQYMSSPIEMDKFIEGLDSRFIIRGLISFMPDKLALLTEEEAAQFEELLFFRLNLALKICPIPRVQGFLCDLTSPYSHEAIGQYPEGVKERLIETLKNHLAPFESIVEFRYSSLQ